MGSTIQSKNSGKEKNGDIFGGRGGQILKKGGIGNRVLDKIGELETICQLCGRSSHFLTKQLR